jgi:spore coat polysaccharide biosynthesis predicted glycosyltransferase SpsG
VHKEKSKRNSCTVSVDHQFHHPLQNARSKTIENVLVLQGRSSLRSFVCGMFKALAKENNKIDIVAGASRAGFI